MLKIELIYPIPPDNHTTTFEDAAAAVAAVSLDAATGTQSYLRISDFRDKPVVHFDLSDFKTQIKEAIKSFSQVYEVKESLLTLIDGLAEQAQDMYHNLDRSTFDPADFDRRFPGVYLNMHVSNFNGTMDMNFGFLIEDFTDPDPWQIDPSPTHEFVYADLHLHKKKEQLTAAEPALLH